MPWWGVVIISCLPSLSAAQSCGFLRIMAPKRRRRASARKGAKKGGSMGGGGIRLLVFGGGPYLCFMYELGIMWMGKMIAS